jgi:hypothetical protein
MYEGTLTNDFQGFGFPTTGIGFSRRGKISTFQPAQDGQEPIGKNYTL